jgi:hypothetical protein
LLAPPERGAGIKVNDLQHQVSGMPSRPYSQPLAAGGS